MRLGASNVCLTFEMSCERLGYKNASGAFGSVKTVACVSCLLIGSTERKSNAVFVACVDIDTIVCGCVCGMRTACNAALLAAQM